MGILPQHRVQVFIDGCALAEDDFDSYDRGVIEGWVVLSWGSPIPNRAFQLELAGDAADLESADQSAAEAVSDWLATQKIPGKVRASKVRRPGRRRV